MNLLPLKCPRLVGVAGALKDTTVSLTEKEFAIGRDSSNDLSTVDFELSRRHCAIRVQDGRAWIRDLGSTNGTRVNGLLVDEQELKDRDRVNVGGSVLIFVVGEPAVFPKGDPVELTGAAETMVTGAS